MGAFLSNSTEIPALLQLFHLDIERTYQESGRLCIFGRFSEQKCFRLKIFLLDDSRDNVQARCVFGTFFARIFFNTFTHFGIDDFISYPISYLEKVQAVKNWQYA